MSEPVISVVIPTHNRVGMVPEAVQSVVQERSVPIEVLVVDDASSDGTARWLATQRDERLRWWSLDPGRGGSGARNLGLAEARGEHVLFLDDDDILRPGALPRLLVALHDDPAAARAMGSYSRFGDDVRRAHSVHPRITVRRPIWKEELFRWNGPPGAILWRTRVVRDAGGWTEGLRRAEDTDLNLRTWRHRAIVLPTPVIDYRYHRTQVPLSEFWPIDREVRLRFIDSLPDAERVEARRLFAAREVFQTGLELYDDRSHRAAARQFVRAARLAPDMFRSPLLGPWLAFVTAKAFALATVPDSILQRALDERHRRRGYVPDNRRAPEDRDAPTLG
ncbi:MAG: glycosyltransferase [Acidimicrobiales bacterium]